ncbi:MAG TPA: RNA polymerase subunit sigma-24, partial [Solirubrobacteraceae bacterium]|nr:RNA polymerase subunit sigma-24 [Solirubrobacteraceae bacterium]
DGGGRARAIPRPMRGAAAVARAMLSFYRLAEEWGVTLLPATVNGQPGVRGMDAEGRVVAVAGFDVAGGAIRTIHSVVNPDKLRHLGPVSDVALRPAAR